MPVTSLLRHVRMSNMPNSPTRFLPATRVSSMLLRSLKSIPPDIQRKRTECLNHGQLITPRHSPRPCQARKFASDSAGTSPTLGGFSYPAPRKLTDVTKLQLLERHGTDRVTEIWNEYHASHKTAFGDVLTDTSYNLFRNRISRCPLFVVPVPRDGGFFTLLVQFQERHCLLTFLEDYKQNVQNASPYLTITFFEELLQSKHVALMRADVTNMITRSEAKV